MKAERKRHRRRNIAALAVVFSLVVPFLLVGGWFVYQLNPPGAAGATVDVEIRDGWGLSEIGGALEREGVIGSSTAFQLYSKITSAGPFQDGPYRLQENMGVRDAVGTLEDGPAVTPEVELTIPPGLTLEQIADQVGELPGRSRDTFLQLAQAGVVRSDYQPPEVTSLEGLLFPDTYRIANDEDEAAILQRLVDRFEEKANEVGLIAGAQAAGRTPYEAIVIASLIEREAGVEEDRVLISAVVRNRLRDGMLLQIDATLCFARGGCDEPLTNADKEIDSPYNTYVHPGLPPTPISGVTEASLHAALTPADVDFLFYVLADPSGKHAFAVTQEEHERNVEAAEEMGLL